MGSVYQTEPHRTVMKAFVRVTLLALASAAPTPDVSSHAVVRHGHGPVISHAVHQPHHGPAIVHAPVHHAVHAPIHHAVHAPIHHAVHVPAPAPYHAPVPAPAPYHAPAPVKYAEEPYTYEYAVADDYSKAAFNAAEASDGKAVTGSYSVALPDGRTQHVKYTADHYNGYIAEVTYEGEAHYPNAPAPYHPAPAPAYHA